MSTNCLMIFSLLDQCWSITFPADSSRQRHRNISIQKSVRARAELQITKPDNALKAVCQIQDISV
jgi:hypothetical protein